MHLPVLLPDIVAVVGDHQGDAGLPCDFQDIGVYIMFILQAMVLELQIEIPLPENTLVVEGRRLGPLIIPPQQGPGHLPGQAGGQGDEPLVVLLQQLEVHPGLVVKALGPGLAHHGGQVAVAGLVFAQEHQVAVFPVQLVDFIQPAPLGHVHLAADDGLDAPLFGGLVKVDDAVHTAVVGDGHGLLAQLLHPVQQLLDAAGPV